MAGVLMVTRIPCQHGHTDWCQWEPCVGHQFERPPTEAELAEAAAHFAPTEPTDEMVEASAKAMDAFRLFYPTNTHDYKMQVARTVLDVAGRVQTEEKPMSKVMRIFGSGESMREARKELGNPAALNEAIVATGIDAFFWLLGGGDIELEEKRYRLVRVDSDAV